MQSVHRPAARRGNRAKNTTTGLFSCVLTISRPGLIDFCTGSEAQKEGGSEAQKEYLLIILRLIYGTPPAPPIRRARTHTLLSHPHLKPRIIFSVRRLRLLEGQAFTLQARRRALKQ